MGGAPDDASGAKPGRKGTEIGTNGSFQPPPADAGTASGTGGAGGTAGAGGANGMAGAGGANGMAGAGGTAAGAGGESSHRLVDTPVGSAPVFDPNEVYIVGYVNDISYDYFYGIAPITAPGDAIMGIPIFSSALIRPTDGHLLYRYSSSSQPANSLYEFHRDDEAVIRSAQGQGASPVILEGEPMVVDGATACATAPRGKTGNPDATGGFAVGLDGAVYHECDLQQDLNNWTWQWFPENPSSPGWGDAAPFVITSEGRVLTATATNSLVVLDAQTGAQYGVSTDVTQLFGANAFVHAVRGRSDGFWVAGGPRLYDSPEAIRYANLDLTGKVVNVGDYAPIPAGVGFTKSNWIDSWPVIDGHGALYQFATEGTDTVVIVKRPLTGVSSVVYRRTGQPNPRDVELRYLLTGSGKSVPL